MSAAQGFDKLAADAIRCDDCVMRHGIALYPIALLLAACQPGGHDGGGADVPGDSASGEPYAGIGTDEMLRFTGTEPFWGGQLGGGKMTYNTPENPAGWTIPVNRFAGRNGLGFSGVLEGESLEMAVTPGACSDGMSDRSYPFVVTLRIGEDVRNGCAWSERSPFSGPENP